MHWAYLLACTQIYLLVRVRKVLNRLFIHWSIRSYRKRGLLPVTYTNLRLSTSIDLCIAFGVLANDVCQRTYRIHRKCNVHLTQKIQNSQLKMTIVHLNNARTFSKRTDGHLYALRICEVNTIWSWHKNCYAIYWCRAYFWHYKCYHSL